MTGSSAIPFGFDGTTRLFPLPNVVFFPSVPLPLHIFEPRYRKMTADALKGDQLITMVLLKPGWEGDYQGRPAVEHVGCLGNILSHDRLPNGRYNLLLRGLSRVRLVEELPSDRVYRLARVEPLVDVPLPPGSSAERKERLFEEVSDWMNGMGLLPEPFQEIEETLTLGTACDLFSFVLPLDVRFKQEMLEELDVHRRMDRLLEHLRDYKPPLDDSGDGSAFPPEFSSN